MFSQLLPTPNFICSFFKSIEYVTRILQFESYLFPSHFMMMAEIIILERARKYYVIAKFKLRSPNYYSHNSTVDPIDYDRVFLDLGDEIPTSVYKIFLKT